jgi:glycosyltransferase involved in cell wall biosynthesis
MPKVSVIIPTHNRPHLLPRAVESARAAGRDVEIIVVDDASTAETARACGKLAGVRYVRVERNQSVGPARNLGILASTADFISFLDDDDLRLPGSLDLQLEALDADPNAGLVYGQALLADENCVPTGGVYPEPCPRGDIFWELLERNFIPCPAVVFRKSCLHGVGLLADSMSGIEDWDIWLRIAELYPVAALERPVAIYRRASPSSGQYTSKASEMAAIIKEAHARRWMRLPRAAEAPRRRRREARRRFADNMATHLIWESGRALFGGSPRGACLNMLAGLRLHPLGVLRRAARPSSLRFLIRTFERRRARVRDASQTVGAE